MTSEAGSWTGRLRRAVLGSAQSHYIAVLGLAVITGAAAGYAAIGFYLAISHLNVLLFGETEDMLATGVAVLDWWWVLGVPAVGGLVIGQLLRFLPRQQSASVPDVIEAAALRGGHVPIGRGLLSAFTVVVALGAGSSTGREGPVVHLGATIAAFVTRLLRLNARYGRTLLGCGVAAAVAASFNAPIAGALFALEVVIGHYALHALAPIVVAAIVGTLISHAHLGNFPAFQVADQKFESFLEFPAFMIVGVASALLAALFIIWARRAAVGVRAQSWLPTSLAPAIGGLLVGGMALIRPEVLGVGYEVTTRAINNDYMLPTLASILALKFLATTSSLAFRFGTGVFSPSLVMGAMLGSCIGIAAGSVFPSLASNPGVYAIVGMGSVAAAVLGAPMSTILIVFEITGDYSLTVAVMIGVAISTVVVTFFVPRSFFHQQLVDRGIHLEGGKATYLLRSETVSAHMSRDFFTICDDEPIAKARDMLILQGGGLLIVTNYDGALAGTLSLDDLASRTPDSDQSVSEILRPLGTVITASAPLCDALRALDISHEEALPVVRGEAMQDVVGVIRHRDVMRAYNAALLDTQGRDDSET